MVDPHPEDPERAAFRRILVALDASQESMVALSTAAQMARRLHAELVGLFVEDENLLKLVQHPFAREVNLLTRIGRSLDTATLERDLKMQAALARRGLERAAAEMQVPWSFRVARGAVEAELLAAALEADIVAIGRSVRRLTGGAGLGRTAQALSLRSRCSLLFGVAAERLGQAVALAYDGSPAAVAALGVAARIADDDGGRLLVFLRADGAERVARFEADIRRMLRGSRLELAFRGLTGPGWAAMLPIVQAGSPRLLVVGIDPNGAAAPSMAKIIESVGCPVLQIRRDVAPVDSPAPEGGSRPAA